MKILTILIISTAFFAPKQRALFQSLGWLTPADPTSDPVSYIITNYLNPVATLQVIDLTEHAHPEAYSDAVATQIVQYDGKPVWIGASYYYTNDGSGNVFPCPVPIQITTWSNGTPTITSPGYGISNGVTVVSPTLPAYNILNYTGKAAILTWQTVSNRFDHVEFSDKPTGPWAQIADLTWIGDGRWVRYIDEANSAGKFYRVMTSNPVNVLNP